MTIEAATDGDIFLAYVEQVLCPGLGLGQVVIMDKHYSNLYASALRIWTFGLHMSSL
jgi:hypothetical protein